DIRGEKVALVHGRTRHELAGRHLREVAFAECSGCKLWVDIEIGGEEVRGRLANHVIHDGRDRTASGRETDRPRPSPWTSGSDVLACPRENAAAHFEVCLRLGERCPSIECREA